MTQETLVHLILNFIIFPLTFLIGVNILLTSLALAAIPYSLLTWAGAVLVTRSTQGA